MFDSKPTAEELLKKLLEFANQGMASTAYNPADVVDEMYCSYMDGKYHAYEHIAEELEVLIKEIIQDA